MDAWLAGESVPLGADRASRGETLPEEARPATGEPHASFNLRQARQPGNSVGIAASELRPSLRLRSVSLLRESFFCAFASGICMTIPAWRSWESPASRGERYPAPQ